MTHNKMMLIGTLFLMLSGVLIATVGSIRVSQEVYLVWRFPFVLLIATPIGLGLGIALAGFIMRTWPPERE